MTFSLLKAVPVFRQLLKQQGFVPQGSIIAKRKCYEAAKQQVMKRVEQRQQQGWHNRAENLQQPTRVRARHMRRCKAPRQAPRF
ncbi:hypothetical protein H6F76_03280 [Leptolyngbya sp. FACHB-321]|uniref:hypothetical protein n=1 Tax=Leptolyngbya sp. FACHB-321 TaxID=2692807 RepID=UPI00198597CE|nr:hypothetical protein [Leptolyngbya sp. FACHB-321]MBD2034073.1 hypothetical protein [Leptolyngbya sp. FACHB-321]